MLGRGGLPLTLTLSPGRGDHSELPGGTVFIPMPICPLSLWSGARSQGGGEGATTPDEPVQAGHARESRPWRAHIFGERPGQGHS
ncbi:hypothetical protein D9M68_867140 [compost metagenome]